MDMDDLTPAGSGSLRRALRPGTPEPVATFTPTRTVHPDEHWQHAQIRAALRSGYREDGPPRPGSREDQGKAGHVAITPHEEVARTIRSALRPGS